MASFANSGVANPDGVTGITLHFDYGQAPYGGGNSVLDPDNNTTIDVDLFFNSGEYYEIKDANFAGNRHSYFHYSLMCDGYSIDGSFQDSSGLGELPGDDFIVSFGQWATGDSNRIGNTVMHELGHNLNLPHTDALPLISSDNLMWPTLNGDTSLTAAQAGIVQGRPIALVQGAAPNRFIEITPVLVQAPEAGSAALLAMGLLGLLGLRSRET